MYNLVVCGGTFDRLHIGHMAFLDGVFSMSKKVVIGLTSEEYVLRYKPHASIMSYEERLTQLQEFIRERGYTERTKIIAIDDVYGKTIDTTYPFEAIVVSEATKSGGEEINSKRQELGLPQLPLISIPLLITDSGVTLSSTLIRSGKIGRQGQFFPNPKWSRHVLHLSDNVREVLHKPFGIVFPKDIPSRVFSSPDKLISVGDATTKRLLEEGTIPKLAVVDFTVERKKLYFKVEDLGFRGEEIVYIAHNPAGTLTPEVWETLENIDSKLTDSRNFVLKVEGEEDLLVIPLILLLPLGYTLLYGQPHEGVVVLSVTEEAKERIFAFLQDFTHE